MVVEETCDGGISSIIGALSLSVIVRRKPIEEDERYAIAAENQKLPIFIYLLYIFFSILINKNKRQHIILHS